MENFCLKNIVNKLQVMMICFLFFFNSSCYKGIAKIFPERPINELPKDQDPMRSDDTSPEFKQGWADGCEVGMSTATNTFYKLFYDTNKADGYKMMNSSDYRAAWTAAFWYCHRVDYVKNSSSVWGSMLGGYR